jgi:hypothetical protein
MKTNQQRTVRLSTLIAGATTVAAATFGLGLTIAHGEQSGSNPVDLRPVSAELPTPPPPPDPHQSNQAVANECFGTTPKPGSTPARPLCDWNKIFADTDARAAALQQQQRDQFTSLGDGLSARAGR